MATITEVAKLAGVSAATVSHVVNQTRYVSPELVKKVEKAIDSLDEVPDFVKRKQKKIENLPKLVVIYIPLGDVFFTNMIFNEMILKYSSEDNLLILPVTYDNLNDKIEEVSNSITKEINGQIILVNTTDSITLKRSYEKWPTIFISKKGNVDTNHLSVTINQHQSSYLATNYLLENNHYDILLLDEMKSENSMITQGYIKALKEKDIPLKEKYIEAQTHTVEETLDFLEERLLSVDPPTAVITTSSKLQLLFSFMKKYNIESPEDISIISTEDCNLLEYFSPPITAIDNNINEILLIVEKFINNILNNEGYLFNSEIAKNHSYDSQLIVRSSTKGLGRGPNGEIANSIDSLTLTENEIKEINAKKRTAVISFHYTGASWMSLHEKAMRDVFDKLNIEIIATTDAYFDPDLQNKQLSTLLTLEPDIFIAIPTDNKKTSKMFQEIANSSSNLILITNVPEGLSPNDYVTVVSVNEHSHGRLTAIGLGDSLRELRKNKIAFFKHGIDFFATNQRDNSAKRTLLEEYSDIQIITEGSFQSSEQLYYMTADLIQKYPEVEGIYVSWEDPAKEVLRALEDYDRTDIIIGTADLDYVLAENMAKNKNVKSISAQQPYEQGRAIALAAANSILNKTTSSYIGIEPIKITRENLLESWEFIFKEEPPKQLKALY